MDTTRAVPDWFGKHGRGTSGKKDHSKYSRGD